MPEGAVYVGRPTQFGNPFPVDVYGRTEAVDLFERWITGHMSARERASHSTCIPYPTINLTTWYFWTRDCLHELRGKDLACWCRPDQACHADVLLELANREVK